MFGKSIHEYKTMNDWFKRDLTEIARAEYLANVDLKEEKLKQKYGEESFGEGSAVVISNSDCRLRFHEIEKRGLDIPQELTGKVLNPEAAAKAEESGDNPAYYANKYLFRVKNLLGRDADDEMKPKGLSADKIAQFSQRVDKAEITFAGADKAQKDKAKKAALKEKNTQEVLNHAMHELLGGVYRIFDEEGAVQVVQRLAPADVHNYVAPLEGTPLSHKEAAKLLAEYASKKEESLKDAPAEEKKKLEEEIKHYAELQHIFLEQERLLEHPSQSTIDIYGTNLSVSTPAIRNQSNILAQNDRKVMLFKHPGGGFSLHVFIGATGVNKVDVDPRTGFLHRGARKGDMQFGPDSYDEKDDFFKSSGTTTREGLNKLRLGEHVGGFPINGSTVVSYYLPNEFSLLPKAQEFQDTVFFGEGKERRVLEVKAKMGDPILVKTDIYLVSALEKKFEDLFADAGTDKTKILETLISNEVLDSPALQKLKMLFTADPLKLSPSETELKAIVERLIANRLGQIRKQNAEDQNFKEILSEIEIFRKLEDEFLMESPAQSA